jgi:hypothetical protein
MIFNVLMIMVALAGGSMDPVATANHPPLRPRDECYVNGIWYNPCPGPDPDSPSPDPHDPPIVLQNQ